MPFCPDMRGLLKHRLSVLKCGMPQANGDKLVTLFTNMPFARRVDNLAIFPMGQTN